MYNDGMQGVDRHDQLRSKFALASRRGFKKYYVTHQLSQVDIESQMMASISLWRILI
jgi:hypothetical protein